jgi:hypothetical protein
MLSASHARVARHLPDESALIDGDPDADSAKVARRVAEATMHERGLDEKPEDFQRAACLMSVSSRSSQRE